MSLPVRIVSAIISLACFTQVFAQTTQPQAVIPLRTNSTSDSEFRGMVVDDQTGAPVASFSIQIGDADPVPPRPGRSGIWMDPSRTMSNNPGELVYRLHTNDGRRIWLRVVADGYLPAMVFPQSVTLPVQALNLIVRMSRGKKIGGQVTDHAGSAVALALVYLVGQDQNLNIGSVIQFAGSQVVTDDNGRYSISGVAANSGQRLVAVMPGGQIVVQPIQGDSDTIDLHFPAVSKLTIRCDYPFEQNEDFAFQLERKTDVDPAWNGIHIARNLKTPNHQSAIIDALGPGEYDVWRAKRVKAGDSFIDLKGGLQSIAMKDAQPAELTFTRGKGQRLRIQTAGLDRVPGLFSMIRIRRGEVEAGVDVRFANLDMMPIVDVLAGDGNALLTSEPLEPGEYTIIGVGMRVRVSGFDNASAKVTIRAGEDPPVVRLDFSH